MLTERNTRKKFVLIGVGALSLISFGTLIYFDKDLKNGVPFPITVPAQDPQPSNQSGLVSGVNSNNTTQNISANSGITVAQPIANQSQAAQEQIQAQNVIYEKIGNNHQLECRKIPSGGTVFSAIVSAAGEYSHANEVAVYKRDSSLIKIFKPNSDGIPEFNPTDIQPGTVVCVIPQS